jgi:hypothetical protein
VVVPEFQEVVGRYAAEFDLDESSLAILAALVRRGSEAVLWVRDDDLRNRLIGEARSVLEDAVNRASMQIRAEGYGFVAANNLVITMESLCPVPPFCFTGDLSTQP